MKMAKLKLQRYSLIKELTLVCFLLLSFLGFKARGGESDESQHLVEITDIKYDYEIITKYSTKADGYAELTIRYPVEYFGSVDSIGTIILEKSAYGHRSEPDHFILRATYRDINDEGILNISVHFSHGTYFRAHVFGVKGHLTSKVYCIDDYISPEDLQKIYGTTEMEKITSSDVGICIQKRTLIIDTVEPICLTVADINGKLLFTGDVCDYKELPLHTSTPFVIARYTDGKSVKTKTILVQ